MTRCTILRGVRLAGGRVPNAGTGEGVGGEGIPGAKDSRDTGANLPWVWGAGGWELGEWLKGQGSEPPFSSSIIFSFYVPLPPGIRMAVQTLQSGKHSPAFYSVFLDGDFIEASYSVVCEMFLDVE
ncbi:hypothetical protein CK203_012565 [Vitis vinifera]|uniref:Uncharacterized protein n=1 Tax=Vitis vinifera TaxID=29760 RepID=A0A438KMQ5_VITVI|nr:hypothetical protein CK203_012565 [Vitis vinifera]